MNHQKLDLFERLKQVHCMEDASDKDLWLRLKQERDTLYGMQDYDPGRRLLLRKETKRKLVVVREDNDLNRKLFCDILEIGLQCVTVIFRDGDEALEVARSHAPDLIQSDIQGPASGLDFARSVRQDDRTKDIPLICISAWGGKEDVVLGAGFDCLYAETDQGAQISFI
jgi:two-component system, cell cycle response regulator DivK